MAVSPIPAVSSDSSTSMALIVPSASTVTDTLMSPFLPAALPSKLPPAAAVAVVSAMAVVSCAASVVPAASVASLPPEHPARADMAITAAITPAIHLLPLIFIAFLSL